MSSGATFQLNLTLDMAAIVMRYRYICCMCPQQVAFLDLCTYLRHILYRHGNFAVQSAMSGVDDRRSTGLPYQRRGDALVCNTCQLETVCVDAFVEHVRGHLLQKPYSCSVCQQDFASPETYHGHLSTGTTCACDRT